MTPEGEVFHGRCREMLGGVDQAEAEITARSGKACSLLRLDVPFSFGLLHLAPLWVAFMALHPKVTLAGTLVEVMPAWRSIELAICAVYPSRKFVSSRVRRMIGFLVNASSMRAWTA